MENLSLLPRIVKTLPLVEIGVIMANVGCGNEAIRGLNNAANRLHMATPHLAFTRGHVLMQAKRFEDALTDFETAIAAKPDYAPALDYAAHCAFLMGDRVEGRSYAKEARKRGRP